MSCFLWFRGSGVLDSEQARTDPSPAKDINGNGGDTGVQGRELLRLRLTAALSPGEMEELQSYGEISTYRTQEYLLIRSFPDDREKLKNIPGVSEVAPLKAGDKTGHLDRDDHDRTGETGGPFLTVIVNTFAQGDKEQVAAMVTAAGGQVLKGLGEQGTSLRVQASPDFVDELAASPLVVGIESYKPPSFLNDRSTGIVGVAPLHGQGYATPRGLDGAGQIVALADSGLDVGVLDETMHPDFQSGPEDSAKVLYLRSMAGNLLPSDPLGHGTHVAGSIAGAGKASGGKYRGAAPGATLYIQSILDREDRADPPANLFELFNPAYLSGARIHVNSWGTRGNRYLSPASQIDDYVRSHPDLLVVFGAGNDGPGPNGTGTIGSEANSKNALVVGASENPRAGLGLNSDNAAEVAAFSSGGPAADGRIKPDLVAPGTSIISTRSRLVPSSFEGNPYYTRMEGTSSAAALAAGSSALLRQYLQSRGEGEPSSALIKAALVNGARKLGHGLMREGFGLLDLQQTVLSLKSGTMWYREEKKGLVQDQAILYQYNVRDSSVPLAVTLAWVDPPAAPGAARALINDLNLTVEGPEGRVYYGNDFNGLGIRDQINNIEQVYLSNPPVGVYTVKVSAQSIKAGGLGSAAENRQDYALVAGQPLHHAVVGDTSQGKIVLSDGRVLTPAPDAAVSVSMEDAGERWSGAAGLTLPPGADVYFRGRLGAADPVYFSYAGLVAQTVRGQGADEKPAVLPLRPELSEGGFYISRSPYAGVQVNGSQAGTIDEILPGSDVSVVLNPSTGEAWWVEAAYRLVSGRVEEADTLLKTLALDSGERYKVNRNAELHISWIPERVDPRDEPFTGWLGLDSLSPGSGAILVMSPWTREIGSVHADNRVVSGTVARVDVYRNSLLLEGDTVWYGLARDAPVYSDGRKAALADVRPGDAIEGYLTPVPDRALGFLAAWDRVEFGVLEAVEPGVIRLEGNRAVYIAPDDAPSFYRDGKRVEGRNLRRGDWLRIRLNESGGPLRVDAVQPDAGKGVIGRVIERDNTPREVYTEGGGRYAIAPYTAFRRDDGSGAFDPRELKPGDALEIMYVQSPLFSRNVIVTAQVSRGGERGRIPADVAGSWALEDIQYALDTGIANLYYDNTFRPGAPVSRVDFAAMLGRALEASSPAPDESSSADRASVVVEGAHDVGTPDSTGLNRAEAVVMLWQAARQAGLDMSAGGAEGPGWSDWGMIPVWSREPLLLVQSMGLVAGQPGNLFDPDRPLTRCEAAVFAARLAKAAV